mgnify:CR=1 FL=1
MLDGQYSVKALDYDETCLMLDGQYLDKTLDDSETFSYHESELEVISRVGGNSCKEELILDLLRGLSYKNHERRRRTFDIAHVRTAIETMTT